jgi:putative hydrolase of the HAD superfamily
MPVDAVLLDAGGVLVLPHPDRVLPQLADLGLHPEPAALVRAHYRAVAAMDASGGEHVEVYRRAYLAECGADPGQVEAGAATLRFSGGWNLPVPGALDLLRRLVASDRGVAIVSNSDGTAAATLAEIGMCQVGPGHGAEVAVVVDSHHAGTDKPDPRIFALALAELAVPPERALHVGDTLRTDIDGALAAGIRPVHLDPYGECPDPAGAHDHVARLSDLFALIEAA